MSRERQRELGRARREPVRPGRERDDAGTHDVVETLVAQA